MTRPSLTTKLSPSQPTAESIAERIRSLRRERGWSLADVEVLSKGQIKAVVLGSYERCDRAMSLSRTIELATLFNVPLAQLLCGSEKSEPACLRPTIMIDLRRSRALCEKRTEPDDQLLTAFSTFISWILNRRCDWNGEVMSLREGDLATLALMAFRSEKEVLTWLQANRLFFKELDRP